MWIGKKNAWFLLFCVVAGCLTVPVARGLEQEKQAEIELLIDDYLTKPGAGGPLDRRLGTLARAFRVDRKQAAKRIGEKLAKLDLQHETDAGMLYRGVIMLSNIIDEAAVKELDVLYTRWNAQTPKQADFRHWLIVALRFPYMGGPERLIVDASPTALPTLAKWLQNEQSPYVLRFGLTVYSDYVSLIPADILKNAKGKASASELQQALRKAKINGLTDNTERYSEVMTWFAEIMKETETLRTANWDKNAQQVQQAMESYGPVNGDTDLFQFLGNSLIRDRRALQANKDKIRQTLTEIDKKIAGLEVLAKSVLSPAKESLVHFEMNYCRNIHRTLAWVVQASN